MRFVWWPQFHFLSIFLSLAIVGASWFSELLPPASLGKKSSEWKKIARQDKWSSLWSILLVTLFSCILLRNRTLTSHYTFSPWFCFTKSDGKDCISKFSTAISGLQSCFTSWIYSVELLLLMKMDERFFNVRF